MLWLHIKKLISTFFNTKENNMSTTPVTIQTILADLQADVGALATYVSSLTPGNTVPVNVAAALAAVQAAQTQLNTDAAANPFVLATVVADVSVLTTAVAALAAAVASPSTP